MSFLNLCPSPELSGAEGDAHRILENEKNRSDLPIMTESNDTMKESQIHTNIPTHPITCMQDAFAESFLESNSGYSIPVINRPKSALSRRQQLLEQNITEETHAARWKPKNGQKHHELWKLMAQISFGIYLLLNGIARDEDQVMKILQVHVDEVDGFLESTLEDFSLAQHDIEDRLISLKAPLLNISVFDIMMEDRYLRGFIVEGNEWIERIITRTASAMNDALKDASQGTSACKQFTIYLMKEQDNIMRKNKANMRKVYEAMRKNVDGWYKAFLSLQLKGNQLDVALVQLGSIVAELDRRAGEVSRRTRFSTATSNSMSNSSLNRLSITENQTSQQIHRSLCRGYQLKPISEKSTTLSIPTKSRRTVECEVIPEMESSTLAELEAPDNELMLKPHTYSPLPSPSTSSSNAVSKTSPPTVAELVASTPSLNLSPTFEISQHSSHRKRPSLSRRNCNDGKDHNQTPVEKDSDQFLNIQTSNSNRELRASTKIVQTPPSRGYDSAYCSDFERTSPQFLSSMPTPVDQQEPTFTTTQANNHPKDNYVGCNNVNLYPKANSPQLQARENIVHLKQVGSSFLTQKPIRIPEQQHFRPVNASPHSPLQRSWTASPLQNPLHARPNSSGSNSSNFSNCSRLKFHSYLNSKKVSTSPSRHVPSAMGRSMQTLNEDRRPKKRKGIFSWLKEQFSLNEEERINFEEKLKIANADRHTTAKMNKESGFQEKKWLDGKKIERGKKGRINEIKK